MVFVGPLRNRTMGFQATVNNHRGAVQAFRNYVGFRECLVGIPASLGGVFLIVGVRAAFFFVIWSLANGCYNRLRHALTLEVLERILIDLKADPMLVKILDELCVRHLI